jgi:hypothetical protein
VAPPTPTTTSATTRATCSLMLPPTWVPLRALDRAPNEASQLAADRGQRLVRATCHMPIAEVQAELCAPGEVDGLSRQLILPPLEHRAATWGMACVVRSFAEHVAQQNYCRSPGNGAAVLLIATRRLNGDHTCVGHQLGRGSRPPKAADFGPGQPRGV